MSLLGIDIGTTGLKAIAFDDDGRVLSQAYREYPLIHPRPEWAELDANSLWEDTKDAIREINSRVKNNPVEAISISSQGEAVVPVDTSGEVLYNFVVAFDNRTMPQFNWWKENFGVANVFKITGMPLHPMHSINKAMWFAESMPEVHSRVWKYLCVEDFIIYRLCGELAIDYSLAARTMAFDITAKRWSREMLDKANLGEDLFSVPCSSGSTVGTVRTNLAEDLGFASRVKVVTGGHDQACGALGSGIISDGLAMNATGTVDVICPSLSRCILDDSMLKNNYCCYPHVYPDAYISVAFNLTGGLLLKWHRDVVCSHEVERATKLGVDPYSLIIDEAASEPARMFVLPSFVGAGTPSLDPESRGAIVGLTISAKRPDLTRAILDSLNYEMLYNIERMESSGIAITEVRAIGGGARSPRWLQMKADVFGRKLSALEVSEAASLGAAMLAGTALGRYSSLDDAVQCMVKIEREYYPDMKNHEGYLPMYETYCRLFPALKEINQRICQL